MPSQAKFPDQQLKDRTLKPAVRLLKAKMRRHVYEVLSATDEDTWAPILLVEGGFLEGAKREWAPVLAKWDLSTPESVEALREVLDAARGLAKADTIDLLQPRVTNIREILEPYQTSPEVSYEGMVGGEDCKPGT